MAAGSKNISDYIIALLLVGFFVGSISLFIAMGTSQYQISYDNSSFTGYDYINEINQTVESLSSASQNISTTSGNAFDIVGILYNQGYSALLITKASFGFGYSLINNLQNQFSFGGAILKLLVTVITTILTLTIAFILFRAIFKDQL